LVELVAAFLTLVIVLSASVHQAESRYPRSAQIRDATIQAAHLLHADTPWAGQTLSDHVRLQAPVEDGFESAPRLPLDLGDETPPSPISAQATDRSITLPDLSTAVHPDRTHAPPFLS
jgi:hypothetical protein